MRRPDEVLKFYGMPLTGGKQGLPMIAFGPAQLWEAAGNTSRKRLKINSFSAANDNQDNRSETGRIAWLG